MKYALPAALLLAAASATAFGQSSCSPIFSGFSAYGSNPLNSSIVADCSLDGKPDIICAGQDNVTMLRNLGNGIFGNPQTLNFPWAMGAITLGDFNRDHLPDIAIINNTMNQVHIVVANGFGDIAANGFFACAANAHTIACGDINRDGRDDLIVGTTSNANIQVFLGATDNATFTAGTTFNGGEVSSQIYLVDLNSDGKLDCVNAGYSQLRVMLGTGTGTFGSPISTNIQESCYGLAFGDFNGDGRLDVAQGTIGGKVGIMLNTGGALLAAPVLYSINLAGNWTSVVVRDLNGDGKLDVLGTTSAGSTILLGRGDGTFQTGASFGGFSTHSAYLADVNADGKLDLIADNSVSLQSSALSVPAITNQPSSQNGSVGASTSFTIAATSINGSPSYQWRRNGMNLSNDARITGANSNTLTINPVQPGDAAAYDCIVSNGCGTTPSSPASLNLGTGGGGCEADFNHDSVIDFFDYLDFVQAFSTGC